MGLDLQRNANARAETYIVILIVWILLLPVGYLLLWKAASSQTDGGAGCLGALFSIPHDLETARQRFRTVNLVLLLSIGVIVICCLVGAR